MEHNHIGDPGHFTCFGAIGGSVVGLDVKTWSLPVSPMDIYHGLMFVSPKLLHQTAYSCYAITAALSLRPLLSRHDIYKVAISAFARMLLHLSVKALSMT
jgi:hypothetical protein